MDKQQFEQYNTIPSEKFAFASNEGKLHDQKLDTKPVGYFRDALRRFAKNKSSLVAAIIIALQLLFAIFVPIFSNYSVDFRDPIYSNVLPSLTVARENGWGFWDGAKTVTGGQTYFDSYDSIGYEDQFTSDGLTHKALIKYRTSTEDEIEDALENDEGDGQVDNGSSASQNYYTMYIDTYFNVGFVYFDLTANEYQALQEYQNETGIQVIYPLQNNYLSVTANYWFVLAGDHQQKATEAANNKSTYQYLGKATALRDADGNYVPDYMTSTNINAYAYDSLRLDYSGTPYAEENLSESSAPVMPNFSSQDRYPVLYDSEGNRYVWYSDSVGYVVDGTTDKAYCDGAVSVDTNWYADETKSDQLAEKSMYYVYAFRNQTGYRVRVNYYEYFNYINGFYPNFAFGTNSYGQDILVCLASGARLSFLLAIGVCVINFFIGAIYGAIEGYYGGATDLIMERVSDILADVPFIVVATLFQLHLAQKVGPVVSLLFAFVLTGWIGMAARVRMQFYRFKNQEYVLASRTLGASDWRVMWKHIFPNSLGTIITGSVLAIPGVIFSESMLSYLGIVNLETSSLTSIGTMLSQGSGMLSTYPHIIAFPAIFIALLEISFNLFGNGLRDAFNPTLRGSEG